MDDVQVGWIARHLREAGLISQGGRGRGGAQMSTADAANLLIGVNASTSAKDAVAAVYHYRELVCSRLSLRSDIMFEGVFKVGKRFGETLEALIVSATPMNGIASEMEMSLLSNAQFFDIFALSFGNNKIGDFWDILEKARPSLHRVIGTSIKFFRPVARVSIEAADTGYSPDNLPPAPPPDEPEEIEKWRVMSAEFHGGCGDNCCDRKDQSEISFRTIMAVAAVIAS
ncbi:hypothetical protein AEGHOMDF_6157 [Methylobacterium soli]|nr:hypothetical protein AEGHOMDF_6157 [Methylobacterium soli]